MKGLGNLANLGNMFKQAQQMKEKLEEIQQGLERETVTASSGGGMVKVTMNGKQKLTAINIDPSLLTADGGAMLEDLIVIAVNEAQDRVQEVVKERMTALTGGLNIPGLTS
ncbi:MAG: YbaB/EbfC family nucleoid-associated protein [bacterium]|nr:YbaB/EbfC family nucleoid-associated protein [bacterium]